MTNKRTLVIEWKHLDVEGETCERCAGTGQEIHQAVGDLARDRQLRGTTVCIRDSPLDADQIGESNAILINGVPIEQILAGTVRDTSCPSCSVLTGQSSCCRAIEVDGTEYELVPASQIRRAIEIVLARV
jgi:hypothetical protein